MINQLLLLLLFGGGNDQARAVDAVVSNAMKMRGIPGIAVAVLREGKPVKVKAYGLASIDYGVHTKTDTPFLLASITKSFTATSILMLAEQGKLRLDDPIQKFLSDTPTSWDGMTIRHLLSHTAGLRDRFEDSSANTNRWKSSYSKTAMYDAARLTPTVSKPGERFQYSDQGYFLLGMIIEQASGETYDNFVKRHIFDPLNMQQSTTIHLSNIVHGLAMGYESFNGKPYHSFRRIEFGMTSHFGVVSTLGDLAKWDAALYGEKLLKSASLNEMWKPATTQDGSEAYAPGAGSYALGWFTNSFNGIRSVGHTGATGTAYFRFPDKKLSVIVLTNLEATSGGDAFGIAKEVAGIYIPELQWENQPSKPRRSSQLRKTLDGLATGKADPVEFEAGFYRQIKPLLSVQKESLSKLGSVLELGYLGGRSLGVGEVVYYRVKFQKETLYATVQLNQKSQIAYLSLEPAAVYRKP